MEPETISSARDRLGRYIRESRVALDASFEPAGSLFAYGRRGDQKEARAILA